MNHEGTKNAKRGVEAKRSFPIPLSFAPSRFTSYGICWGLAGRCTLLEADVLHPPAYRSRPVPRWGGARGDGKGMHRDGGDAPAHTRAADGSARADGAG